MLNPRPSGRGFSLFRDKLQIINVRRNTGALGWAITTAAVVGYDLWAILTKHQTMSAWFGRQLANPCRRGVLAFVWGLLTWHLFGDGKYDPLSFTSREVGHRIT